MTLAPSVGQDRQYTKYEWGCLSEAHSCSVPWTVSLAAGARARESWDHFEALDELSQDRGVALTRSRERLEAGMQHVIGNVREQGMHCLQYYVSVGWCQWTHVNSMGPHTHSVKWPANNILRKWRAIWIISKCRVIVNGAKIAAQLVIDDWYTSTHYIVNCNLPLLLASTVWQLRSPHFPLVTV